MTEEHKRKIGLARRGVPSNFKGRHHTMESKLKMSKSRIGRFCGENHPMFGIHRFGKENPNWKNRNITKQCEYCNKEFQTFISLKQRFCSKVCVNKWQIESGIHKGENNVFYGISKRGSKSWAWKGGIAPLHSRIRESMKYIQWRSDVFQRDSWTCQTCGKNGGNLEAHHLTPFSTIFKEFLQKYNQFSPIEDKETLVRLSESYEEFWDINNAITLCKKCHKLTFSYRGKNVK